MALYRPLAPALPNALWVGFVQDVLFELEQMKEHFRAATGDEQPFGDSNRLQRSMRAAKDLKYARDSTSWVANFLLDFHGSLAHCVTQLASNASFVAEHAIDDLAIANAWIQIQDMVELWKRLFVELTSSTFNEMTFHTCLSLLRSHVTEERPYHAMIDATCKAIGQSLATASAQSGYETSLHIDNMWDAFRPQQLNFPLSSEADEVQNDLLLLRPVHQIIAANYDLVSKVDLQSCSNAAKWGAESGKPMQGWGVASEAVHALTLALARQTDIAEDRPYMLRPLAMETLRNLWVFKSCIS